MKYAYEDLGDTQFEKLIVLLCLWIDRPNALSFEASVQ